MPENATLTFYKIKTCGYHQHGRQGAVFGGVSDTLEQLRVWISGKQLSLTKTYEAVENGSLPAYAVDVTSQGDQCLLTLWNEIPSTDGAIAAIDGTARVGAADVKIHEVQDGGIPGHASYFWFLPMQGLVASVRFQHLLAGHFQMGRYIQGFLEKSAAHVVYSEEAGPDGELEIVGYRQNQNSPIQKLRPRFRSEIYRREGPLEFILNNSHRIRRLEKKASLKLLENPGREWWQKMLDQFHLTEPDVRPEEVKIKYDLQMSGLTRDQVQTLIDEWRAEYEQDDDNNYGFKFVGDGTTYWLASSYVRDTIQIETQRINSEIVDPRRLLQELGRFRDHFLSMIDR